MLRRTLPLLASVVTVIALLAPAANAEQAPPRVGPRIVGGGTGSNTTYAWTAVLQRDGSFTCGASVLSRSWALTAAHCVIGGGSFDVRTGSTSLYSGGQVLHVAGVHVHPSYHPATNDYDVALLRLARPTSATEIAVIGSSASELALDDPGTTAYTSGWGTTSEGGSISPTLRSVDVPIQSDATCSSSYPTGFEEPDTGELLEYHASNMICAGPLTGGKDSCQGDSGGPLAVQAPDDSWRLVGAVSFGLGCAEAGYPGVYQRLSATASWIGTTRRFGPFAPDGTSYITRQYLDFAGRTPTSSELSSWRSKLASSPAADLISNLQAAAAWDGNAGMNARLYQAAFLRNPDTSGFDYWVRARWGGRGPVSIANHFAASSEFQATYGSLSTSAFVTQIYDNVFHRAPDPSGRSYWTKKLDGGAGRGQMLYELSNSSEFRRGTATTVRIITTRFGLLRTVPTAAEITNSTPLSQRTLIDTLRTSYRYASRFSG